MLKFLSIVGNRPQFTKLKVLHQQFENIKKIQHIICHSGQHYDYNMSEVFLRDLSIPTPRFNLNVHCKSSSSQAAKIMSKFEKILIYEKPNVVIVYGDTNTTLAGALTAGKLGIPIAHVEAGLRSFNKAMPEEQNRILVDHISSFLFCPTQTAVNNLKCEGISKNVYLVGDVMLDCFNEYQKKIKTYEHKVLQSFNLKKKEFGLATIHRQNNTDTVSKVYKILNFLNHFNFPVLFPVHPRTQQKLNKKNIRIPSSYKNIQLTFPVSYSHMLCLEKNAKIIITDSGGIQKEAFWLKKPCITLREETEWPETLTYGWNKLVSIEKPIPKNVFSRIITPKHFDTNLTKPFAGKNIRNILLNHFL